MKALEARFEEQLKTALERAQADCHVPQKRLAESVKKRGALVAAKESLGRKRASEGFYGLEKAKRLDLSLEALAAREEYAPLFSDDEVNFCMDLLCEYGYYNG